MLDEKSSRFENKLPLIDSSNSKREIQQLKAQFSEFLLDDEGYMINSELKALKNEKGLIYTALVDFLKNNDYKFKFKDLKDLFLLLDSLFDFLDLEEIFNLLYHFEETELPDHGLGPG